MIDEPTINKPLIGVALAVAVVAFGGWTYWHGHRAVPAPPTEPAVSAPAALTPEDTIQHPVPASQAAVQAPLPALGDSDAAFGDALNEAAGAGALGSYWVPESLIRHIVVTVDNLPRQKVALDKRPVTPVAGAFIADGDELRSTIDEQNYRRYTPLVSLIDKVDLSRLVAVYLRFYPLFQTAYQDLGSTSCRRCLRRRVRPSSTVRTARRT